MVTVQAVGDVSDGQVLLEVPYATPLKAQLFVVPQPRKYSFQQEDEAELEQVRLMCRACAAIAVCIQTTFLLNLSTWVMKGWLCCQDNVMHL